MGDIVLQVVGLCKEFGDNKKQKKVTVLKDIELSVSKGEIVCLIGQSGSGKSTLLRCLNMLEVPDSGKVVFDGIELDAKDKSINDKRQKIGFVFQNFNLFANMTVLKNITIAPLMHGQKLDKNAVKAKAMALLERFGLQDKASVYPNALSGGQKQRVAIVRALMCEPQIMLFDEPTSALDPEMVKEVLDVITQLKESGMTMIIVTHEMRFARSVASRVVFLDKGKIAEQNTPSQIFDFPQSTRLQEFLSKLL